MTTAVILIIVGIALLAFAADRFVAAAARLAKAWGASPILIGAVIIGMGTSAPEFIVSVVSGGQSFDLALGNIAGSTIANLSRVLGASVMVASIAGQQEVLRREGVLMLSAVVLFAGLTWDGQLDRPEGILLAVGTVLAGYLLVRWSKTDGEESFAEELDEFTGDGEVSVPREIIFGLVTLAVMLIGADMLADGAIDVAEELGVSAGFIGLTVVALGTSLPELAAAIAAARRRENDLIVGNLLGSNLFNSLVVAGGVALIRPGSTSIDFRPTMLAMVAIAALAGILTATGHRLVRAEGVVLLAVYAGYITIIA